MEPCLNPRCIQWDTPLSEFLKAASSAGFPCHVHYPSYLALLIMQPSCPAYHFRWRLPRGNFRTAFSGRMMGSRWI